MSFHQSFKLLISQAISLNIQAIVKQSSHQVSRQSVVSQSSSLEVLDIDPRSNDARFVLKTPPS
jgi:hypothetical protein